MRLSSKGKYAVSAMMVLAMKDLEGPVTLKDISKEQGISLSYLEQLFAKLRDSGLVSGVRGPGGGYRLSRKPTKITVADILDSVEVEDEDVAPMSRVEGASDEINRANSMWSDFNGSLRKFLAGITLAQYLDEKELTRAMFRQDADSKRMNFVLPRPISF